MSVALSPALQQARLGATLTAIGASGIGARVLRPAAGTDTDTPALAEVQLAVPPGIIAGDKIILAPLDPAGVLIRASGQATWARIVGSDEQWLMDCDVCGPSGNGDWKITVDGLPAGASPTQLYEGGTFVLGTVTLA